MAFTSCMNNVRIFLVEINDIKNEMLRKNNVAFLNDIVYEYFKRHPECNKEFVTDVINSTIFK